jgi:hypothetical protein
VTGLRFFRHTIPISHTPALWDGSSHRIITTNVCLFPPPFIYSAFESEDFAISTWSRPLPHPMQPLMPPRFNPHKKRNCNESEDLVRKCVGTFIGYSLGTKTAMAHASKGLNARLVRINTLVPKTFPDRKCVCGCGLP